MAKNSRARLLRLAKREYQPDAWRNQDDVVKLLSQFSDESRRLEGQHGRWIPYSMPAVDAVRDALLDGTIQEDVVPQVIENAYSWAFERKCTGVTRSIICRAITNVLHHAAA